MIRKGNGDSNFSGIEYIGPRKFLDPTCRIEESINRVNRGKYHSDY